jgi:hypothetical protein
MIGFELLNQLEPIVAIIVDSIVAHEVNIAQYPSAYIVVLFDWNINVSICETQPSEILRIRTIELVGERYHPLVA